MCLFQIWGVQDLFVFDQGSFFSDSNSSLGRDTDAGQYSLQSLNVQDRGLFELHSSDKDLTSQLSITNLTVRKLYLLKNDLSNNDLMQFSFSRHHSRYYP